jgi:hypothetical protein
MSINSIAGPFPPAVWRYALARASGASKCAGNSEAIYARRICTARREPVFYRTLNGRGRNGATTYWRARPFREDCRDLADESSRFVKEARGRTGVDSDREVLPAAQTVQVQTCIPDGPRP